MKTKNGKKSKCKRKWIMIADNVAQANLLEFSLSEFLVQYYRMEVHCTVYLHMTGYSIHTSTPVPDMHAAL